MKKQHVLFLWGLILSLVCFESKGQHNPHKAPLYWNPYEYCFTQDNYIPENVWAANIDWVEQNLKQYGYNMVCIDGWGDDAQYNQDGYRTTHSSNWNHSYQWWSNNLQSRGMTLGIYNNPLWINRAAADAGVMIKGTSIPLSSLIDDTENSLWFTWAQVDRPGAEEYVKGYIQFYADMGVKFLRVDFLSWFEDGFDKNPGTVGVNRPKWEYETALQWMKEACDANGIFLSLVMPHLKNNAELEKQYGHMIRINEDVGEGEWERFNNFERGVHHSWWSQWYNTFDGYTYWSQVAGRNKVILDGDFIRLNTMANVEEKKTVISLHLMAGGPLSIADQYNTIGNDLWLYQNAELLALNQDGFVGKPLFNSDPTDESSQVWAGQMSNGDWIVGLFNREDNTRNRSLDFSWLGINNNAKVRDLWAHEDLGTMTSYSVDVPPHGCVILKVVEEDFPVLGGEYKITARHSGKALDVSNASANNGALVHQWDYASGDNQKWRIEDAGNGLFKLISVHSGKALDIVGGSQNDGADVHQWENLNVESQKWRIEYTGNGYFKIINNNSNRGLDVYGASTTNGAQVKQYAYTGGVNQQWSFELLNNDTTNSNHNSFEIKNEKLKRNDTMENKGVKVYPNPASDAIKFELNQNYGNVIIFNIYGENVYEKYVTDKVVTISTALLPEGVYFINIQKGGRTSEFQKFIIKR